MVLVALLVPLVLAYPVALVDPLVLVFLAFLVFLVVLELLMIIEYIVKSMQGEDHFKIRHRLVHSIGPGKLEVLRCIL